MEEADCNQMLNSLFCYVFAKMPGWQGLRTMAVTNMEQFANNVKSDYKSIESTPSGPSLGTTMYYSKQFIAYLESFLGLAPWPAGRKDTRVDMRLDKLYANAMRRYSATKDNDFCRYLKRRMEEWYTKFPPSAAASGDGASADEAQDGGAAGDSSVGDGPALVLSDPE